MKRKADKKPIKTPIFKTTIRQTETIIRDREGKPRKIITMRRYRNPLIYQEQDLTKNPDKIVFAIITNEFGDRLELFAYKNNPEKAFISLNGQVMGATPRKWSEIQSGITKMGKFLGVLK
jgi:hypothetical protein